jgi:hypothetical protein
MENFVSFEIRDQFKRSNLYQGLCKIANFIHFWPLFCQKDGLLSIFGTKQESTSQIC